MVQHLINTTLNQTITASASQTGFDEFMHTHVPLLLERIKDLLTVPITVPEVWWIISPMIISMLILSFYFGRYRGEELGWNSAVSNSLVLVFVSVDLFRYWFTHNDITTIFQNVQVLYGLIGPLLVGFLGIWLLFFEFFHLIPKQIAFFIGSSIPINVIAYTAIANVYSGLPFDIYTLIAMIVLFFIVYSLFMLIRELIPQAAPHGREKEL
ncbi:hypothetical protein D6774_03355 [Candidatus Woesearchaeota archaeon]|nr:MAG: hypothetical protein D6774_03355 [Candidatus Woesearchaeota archaeon]